MSRRRRSPEQQQRHREYMRAYNSRPEVVAHRSEYARGYRRPVKQDQKLGHETGFRRGVIYGWELKGRPDGRALLEQAIVSGREVDEGPR